MRVRAARDIYYYPDVAVVCGRLDDQAIFADDPCVIVEVTSPSTARVDRSEKLDAYRQIAALRAYLIVDHRRRRVERHWRDAPDASWQRTEVIADGHVPIPCLDVEVSLDEIYRRVELPAVWEPEPVEYEA
jgi:Uma2 family endonuclease